MDETQLKKELRDIKRELGYGSFDTVYTSVLVLVIGIAISILLTFGPNGTSSGIVNSVVIFLGATASVSLLLQFVSLFVARRALKFSSIALLLFSVMAIVVSVLMNTFNTLVITILVYLPTLILYIALQRYFDKVDPEE